MSVVITRDDLIAYAEVDYIIKHMNERYVSKLPQNLIDFFDTIKEPDYEIYIDPHRPLQSQGLKKYTLEIIALLHVKYWCENQERKEELIEKMKKNQDKFEAKLREQFNTEKIFSNGHIESNKISNDDAITTAFSKYTVDNPDIQDYTDIQENEQTEDLPETVKNKTSFLGKIKLFVSKIFGKSTN